MFVRNWLVGIIGVVRQTPMMADYRKNILDLILGPYPINARNYSIMMILI
jgi:hypothetical protein